MKLLTVPEILSKYRISEWEIKGDGTSNHVHISVKYKLPRFFRRQRSLIELESCSGKEFVKNKLLFFITSTGWGDALCRTRQVNILIVPNNGKTIYNNEIPVQS